MHRSSHFFKLVLTAVGLLAFAPAGFAQVLVNVYQDLGTFFTAGTTTTSFSFSSQTANDSILLVAFGSEESTINSVTFNGDTITTPVTSTDTTRESAIFAFNLGSHTGVTSNIDVNATTTSSQGYSISAVQISNADFSSLLGTSVQTTGSSFSAGPDALQTFGPLAAGSFYFDVVAANNGSPFTTSGATRTFASAGQTGFNASSQSSTITNASGTLTDIGWSGLNGSSALSAVTVSAIPEPNTAWMAILGFGLVLLRRKRQPLR